MAKPEEPPLPAPLTPPQKECPDCDGSGNKPLKFLGERTDPCPSCAGTGTIEVAEEPLTPWQQEVVTLLRRIDARLEQPTYEYQIKFDGISAGPIPPAIVEQMKKAAKP